MATEDIHSKKIVEQFWTAMNTNDFLAAAELLHDEFVLEWPQSGERIHGRTNFAALNEHYPAVGRWSFTIHRVVADGDEVVTEVTATDGVTTGRAITFSTVREGKILKQVEYWPDPFEPAAWRVAWIERV